MTPDEYAESFKTRLEHCNDRQLAFIVGVWCNHITRQGFGCTMAINIFESVRGVRDHADPILDEFIERERKTQRLIRKM